jgi:hypothetical protein
VPRRFCGWNNRFDDPQREYRTIYCAKEKKTALREVLADLRPNTRAIADFEALYGSSRPLRAGKVTGAWRNAHALAPAAPDLQGHLVDLDEVEIRRELEWMYAGLLAERRMPHLDIGEVRSRDRVVTQAVGRALYDRGAAGVRFRSNLDDRGCTALFEGRGRLIRAGEPIPMTGDVPELLEVCAEWSLTLAGT